MSFRFWTPKNILGLASLVFLLVGVVITTYLTQQRQTITSLAEVSKTSPNRPPVTPLVNGLSTGSTNTFYNFSIRSFDFDGQKALAILALPTMYAVSDSVFQSQLDTIKAAGIDAVHVDIPWQFIEPQEGVYDFTFTKNRLRMIADKGLLIQPGIAIQLNEPAWFRTKYPDIDFVSEEGKRVRDYHNGQRIEFPSYWHPQTKLTVERLEKKYVEELENDPKLKDKILFYFIPAGFWGEPHYPIIYNYSSGDATFYYWAYDPYAQVKFRSDMQTKYGGNLGTANTIWQTGFTDWTQVKPPKIGEFTANYWRDFLNWYKDEKNSFISWNFNLFINFTQRPYYTTSIVDWLNPTDWENTINTIASNRGSCGANCQDNKSYPEIKRMYNTGALIPQFSAQHLFTSPGDLPWTSFADQMVKQIWGGNYGVVIVGEAAGDWSNPDEVATKVIDYGFDGMRYVGPNYLLNPDGTFNQINFGQIAAALQKVKSYRNIASVYTDRIKYVIDWGDGTSSKTNLFTPGTQYGFIHRWDQTGAYQVKVKATDTFGAESFWSEPMNITITTAPPITAPDGPCKDHLNDCTFNTRELASGLNWATNWETVTAYGKYWNWDDKGNPMPDNGSLLSSIPRYTNGPCVGYLNDCKFDTVGFTAGWSWGETTAWESVTAYGKYWNWDMNGNPLPGNGSLLSSVPRYAEICKDHPNDCKFDTRTFATGQWGSVTKWETVTAYGKYWNWDDKGNPLGGNGSLLSSVPRYAEICKDQPNDCKFDGRAFATGWTSWGSVTTWEEVTAYGKYWNWDDKGNPLGGNGSLLSSVPRYANGSAPTPTPTPSPTPSPTSTPTPTPISSGGPCASHLNDCTFDTREVVNGLNLNGVSNWESVTAYGKYWIWDISGNPLPGNTTPLASISRYDTGPCAGHPNDCTLDTRAFAINQKWGSVTNWESVTAYGKYWNWDMNGELISGGSGELKNVSRYAAGPCAANPSPGTTCKFDTRTFANGLKWGSVTSWESVTAYGKYWNWDLTKGNSLPGNGSLLSSVPRYANGPCVGYTNDCKFDSRTLTSSMESVTAYGKYWNWDMNGKPLPGNGSLLSSVLWYQ